MSANLGKGSFEKKKKLRNFSTNFLQKKKISLKTLKNLEKYHKFVQNYGDFQSFSGQ